METISLPPVSPSSSSQISCPTKSSTSMPLEEIDITEASELQFEEIITQASSLAVTEAAPEIEEFITEDGILCIILSSLTLIEAARTSVLSTRWRNIWTHLTKLNFDAVNILDFHTLRGRLLSSEEAYNLTEEKKTEFIQSVDSVLQKFQGARVDEISVKFSLDKRHTHHIDEWVRFAVGSKTKMFRLHLFRPHSKSLIEPYEFPCDLLQSSLSIEIFSLFFCSLKMPHKFHGLSRLKILVLMDMDVSEEDLNQLLSNCSSTLLKLCVCCAPNLASIIISHPVNQLHTLLVQNCPQLRKIEINAINLLKLNYTGFPVDFKFRQSSKLKDAEICFINEGAVHNMDFYLTKLSSSLPQLQSLILSTRGVSQEADLSKGSHRFMHLKHLEWTWNDSAQMSLFHLATLLDAAPMLEELKLCISERVLEQPPQKPSKFREMIPKHHRTNLKTIHITGFYFDMWQIEIAAYLVNNAPDLESVMIEKGSTPSWFVTKEIHERGTEILRQQVPENVKLVITGTSPGPYDCLWCYCFFVDALFTSWNLII